MRYPSHEPDRDKWLALDEAERIALVSDYHRHEHNKVPNLRAHAAIHVAVENQALMGSETPVAETLVRLIDEGLDRHDAIHAIAFALSSVMFNAAEGAGGDLSTAYFRDLAALTAEKWRAQADEGGRP